MGMDNDDNSSNATVNKSSTFNPVIHFYPSFRSDLLKFNPTVVYLGNQLLKTTFNPHIAYISSKPSKKPTSNRKVNKGYACDICGRVCATSGHLKSHKVVHNKSKDVHKPNKTKRTRKTTTTHACNICGKVCASSGHLKNHQVVHNRTNTSQYRIQSNVSCVPKELKEHSCSICGKVCASAGYLKRHQVVHQKEKLQSSEDCVTSVYHLRNFGDDRIAERDINKCYVCPTDSKRKLKKGRNKQYSRESFDEDSNSLCCIQKDKPNVLS